MNEAIAKKKPTIFDLVNHVNKKSIVHVSSPEHVYMSEQQLQKFKNQTTSSVTNSAVGSV